MGPDLANSRKLCHSLNFISGSMAKAVAKSCGGQVQSIPHVIQGAAGCQAQLVAKKSDTVEAQGRGVKHRFYLILRSSVTQ